MALGPGKYDDLLTEVRLKAKAEGALLLVVNGDRGSGFSAQLPLTVTLHMPALLRDLANQIEAEGLKA